MFTNTFSLLDKSLSFSIDTVGFTLSMLEIFIVFSVVLPTLSLTTKVYSPFLSIANVVLFTSTYEPSGRQIFSTPESSSEADTLTIISLL